MQLCILNICGFVGELWDFSKECKYFVDMAGNFI